MGSNLPREGRDPADLIFARYQALADGDFGFIFDSYHPHSNFRSLFPRRDSYLDYGEKSLGRSFRILERKVLRTAVRGNHAKAIFFLVYEQEGQREEVCEMVRFRKFAGEWKVFSMCRLQTRLSPEMLEEIDWSFFQGEPEF